MQEADKWIPAIVFHGQRSPPKTDNSILVGSLRIRTNAINLCTVHECHLKYNMATIIQGLLYYPKVDL